MSNATKPRARTGTKQDYGTPWELIHAVERRFGKIFCDLAATSQNAKAAKYITPEQDSLTSPWPTPPPGQILWLNPPFANIFPWVQKCANTRQNVYVLVPAAVGSNWFRDQIEYRAQCIYFLNPRLKFEGATDPYPKDLMICSYFIEHPVTVENFNPSTHYEQWRWK